MTYYKFSRYDLQMILAGVFLIFANYAFNYIGLVDVFNFWHYILASMAFGGYITLRLFTSYQRYLADKKGLTSQLDLINELLEGKKK